MRKLKVGILTFHFSDNFGALFQAYALRKWFLDEGCEAFFINYCPDYVEGGGAFLPIFKRQNAKANLKILYLRGLALRRKLLGNREQEAAFEKFRAQFLGVSAEVPEFLDNGDEGFLDQVDLLVCGSDQIWNPSAHRGVDPAYFLSFSRSLDKVRKVSYAASFGKGALDARYSKDVGELIKGLDGVSVREESGVRIVREVAGVSAMCVPDPTILLGDFTDLIQRSESTEGYEGGVFCYALRTGSGVREVADAACKHFGAKAISPYNPHRRWPEIGQTVYPSPGGWIRMLAGARFVVTNSFHGVALSIICHRPFVFVSLPGAKKDLNERVSNLVKKAGLEQQVVSSDEISKAIVLFDKPIDWGAVDERISAMRAEGERYLRHQLRRVLNNEQSV